MGILLDSKNKSVQDFLIYRKIQDGRQGSKVQNRPNLSPQITFRLDTWYFIDQILTKFGMVILLDPKNKSAQEFLI